ncbi:hypothetical protein [Dactylosporangium sp. NPDC051541]|uniref:hypothetical protein n=1 Tax=Dactylosporangium sp. NPDC051541 TaxID=3363977 RepID=UPI003792A8F4
MTIDVVQDYWDSVPTVAAPDVTADGSPVAAAPDGGTEGRTMQSTLRAHRRTLLKTVGVLGGGFALNVLSWLPPARGRAAQATVGTEYTSCTIYSYDDSITCTGGPYGSGYCGSDGWFLQYSGTCFSSGAVSVCNNRNAWRWKRADNQKTYRCADGMQYWCGGSGFYICAWQL